MSCLPYFISMHEYRLISWTNFLNRWTATLGVQLQITNFWKLYCKEREINLQCETVKVESNRSGLESAARNRRYKIFKEILKPGDQLLLAHHADDVAETILFRLFRGTGLDGLEGPMRKRALGEGVILRPWLEYTKSDLTKYLLVNKIEFISDETNFEEKHDRNFIRNEILKLASNRWPKASQQIQQTSELVYKQKKVHDFLLEQQFGSIIRGPKLPRKPLVELDHDICIGIIRFWIKQNNVSMPSASITRACASTMSPIVTTGNVNP